VAILCPDGHPRKYHFRNEQDRLEGNMSLALHSNPAVIPLDYHCGGEGKFESALKCSVLLLLIAPPILLFPEDRVPEASRPCEVGLSAADAAIEAAPSMSPGAKFLSFILLDLPFTKVFGRTSNPTTSVHGSRHLSHCNASNSHDRTITTFVNS